MPFYAIPGTYHVKGLSPDGDSIRFKATNPDHWDLLDGPAVRVDSKQRAQLRLEAIDALETHYRAGGRTWHQPKEFANAATDRLLDMVGIKNVVWPPSRYRVRSADDGTHGYILSRTAERYRRPVSFAYAGRCPYKPGEGGESERVKAAKERQLQNADGRSCLPDFLRRSVLRSAERPGQSDGSGSASKEGLVEVRQDCGFDTEGNRVDYRRSSDLSKAVSPPDDSLWRGWNVRRLQRVPRAATRTNDHRFAGPLHAL